MRDLVLKRFDKKYHPQIKMNFPKVIVDTSEGIPPEKKHLNAMSLVKGFNAIFNKREAVEDKKQAYEMPTTSDQQFVASSDEDEEVTQKKKKSKKRPV
jgi:biotin synthase-like enzyme